MRQLALAVGVIMIVTTGAAGADNRFERSLRRLSPNERVVQLCDYTAMQRIRHAKGHYRPDRAVADARSQVTIDKNTVHARGGAFRSRGKWYALSYTCTASADKMKVVSFKYKIGAEIPQAKWAAYSLWQ